MLEHGGQINHSVYLFLTGEGVCKEVKLLDRMLVCSARPFVPYTGLPEVRK